VNRLGAGAVRADAVRSRGVGPGGWDGGVCESLWADRRPPVQYGLLSWCRTASMASSHGAGPLRAVSDLRQDGERPQGSAAVWSSHPYVVVGEVRLVGSHAAVLTQAKPAAFLRHLDIRGIPAPSSGSGARTQVDRAPSPCSACGSATPSSRPAYPAAGDGWTTIILDRRGPYCHSRIHANQVSVRGSPFPLRQLALRPCPRGAHPDTAPPPRHQHDLAAVRLHPRPPRPGTWTNEVLARLAERTYGPVLASPTS
jgi:hypothetical protein